MNLSIEAPEGSIPSQVLVMACQALGPGGKSIIILTFKALQGSAPLYMYVQNRHLGQVVRLQALQSQGCGFETSSLLLISQLLE